MNSGAIRLLIKDLLSLSKRGKSSGISPAVSLMKSLGKSDFNHLSLVDFSGIFAA